MVNFLPSTAKGGGPWKLFQLFSRAHRSVELTRVQLCTERALKSGGTALGPATCTNHQVVTDPWPRMFEPAQTVLSLLSR